MAQNVKIDPAKLEAWREEQGLTKTDVANLMGMGSSFVSGVLRNGYMAKSSWKLMQKTFDLPFDAFRPEEPKPVKAEPEKPNMVPGYEISLQVYPDRLRIGMLYDGKEVHYAWSKILGNTELELVKSISYAAHMMYKYAEQDSLKVA